MPGPGPLLQGGLFLGHITQKIPVKMLAAKENQVPFDYSHMIWFP
jgi:hypothetical protein